jgi:hypothetical protein
MIAVKERPTVVPVWQPESSFKPNSASGGPPEPPEPPPGGGRGGSGGNSRIILYLIAFLLAGLLTSATADSYSVVLGNTAAVHAVELFAWFILIVAAGKCSMKLGGVVLSQSQTVEAAIEKAKVRLSNRFWDGLLLIVLCFHLAVYNNMAGIALIAALAALLITLTYLVERVRFQYFPQSSADLADLLSNEGVL